MKPRKSQHGASSKARGHSGSRKSAATSRRRTGEKNTRSKMRSGARTTTSKRQGDGGRAKAATSARRSAVSTGTARRSRSRTTQTARRSSSPRRPASAGYSLTRRLARILKPLQRADRRLLTPFVATLLVFAFAWTYYPVARVQYREMRQEAELESELAQLQVRNARLQREVDRLKTPEGIEDTARTSLGLIKKGEHAVVVVQDSSEATLQAPPEVGDTDVAAGGAAGPWTAFLDTFFRVGQ
jgi:cell division protein FtsB